MQRLREQRWAQVSWWHWDRKAEEWSDAHSPNVYDAYIEQMQSDDHNNGLNKLTLLSYNVLHDKLHRDHILRPDLRYRRILDLLERVDVDLIGLNEVDSTFQQELLKERWVRERFYVSDASDSAETLQGPWGNLLLSRFPFHSLYTISMTGASRKTLAGVVDLCVSGSMRRMCVCSVHTSAFPWNVPKRRMQLEELQVTIERELPVSFDDIIIMGDLNLRRPEEEALIPEGYLDLWPAVRSDPGYTFDAVKNKMIGEAWPLASKTRRMRLDRIILKSTPRSSPFWTPESMRLFAHTPVASPIEEDEDEDQERKALRFERERQRQRKLVAFWWMVGCLTFVPRLLKMVVEASFDLFGVNVFRNVDDYLWPSDHFGLVAVLTASLEEESSSE